MQLRLSKVIGAQRAVEAHTPPYPFTFRHAYMWSPNVGGDVVPEQVCACFL
jgi:hypothetical protein